jgi:hypothetical protein
MSEQDRHPEPNPEPGHPAEEPLPEESPTAGEAARRKGDVELEEPKAGRPGDEHHGAGHGDPAV